MAESLAHRFGQIIGEVLEAAVIPRLTAFAKTHDLYLDMKGPRPCRKGRKCSWYDAHGNKHDLDFVLERGGTLNQQGAPAAFIETAWRRYTKHSKNKAQEIQGAVLPLVERYHHAAPFAGAIIAGEFTENALTQMRSLGFSTVHVPYKTVVSTFNTFGIDASSNEDTPETEFKKKVKAYEALSADQQQALGRSLIDATGPQWTEFVETLEAAVMRQIACVIVLPLHGASSELLDVDEAIRFIEGYDDQRGGGPVERYEIQIRYTNGDQIDGKFTDKLAAIKFLRGYSQVAL